MLNTSLNPHFVALYSADGESVAVESWTAFREDTDRVIHFLLQQRLDQHTPLQWVGGVTGPGGFSSLRAASSLLQGLSLTHGCPIRGVSAEALVRFLLMAMGVENPRFVLNSFGQRVFLVEDTMTLLTAQEAAEQCRDVPVCTTFLPEEKAAYFLQRYDVDVRAVPGALFSLLSGAEDRDDWVPLYAFPPVESAA